MHGEDEETAFVGQRFELGGPALEHFGWTCDDPGAGDVRQVVVSLPVIQRPVGGQLDDRRGTRVGTHGESIRVIRVHQTAVVAEAMTGEELRQPVRGLPHRCAIAGGTHSEHLIERLEPAQKARLLGRAIGSPRTLVEVAVVADLVTGVANRACRLRPAFGAVAGDEERRPNALPVEESEEPRDGNTRPVRLMAHDVEPLGSLRTIEKDRALGIEIEGEAGGCAEAFGPTKTRRQRVAPRRSRYCPTRLSATSESIS